MAESDPSSRRALTALVVLQTVAALGTIAWWVYWFASGSNIHAPECDRIYENSFPVGDLVMAAFVLAAAVQTHRRRASALFFGFAGAGMALDLAVLDTAHNLFTHAFDAPILTILQKAVFAIVNTLVGIATLRTLNRHRSDFPGAGSGQASPLSMLLSRTLCAATLIAIAAYGSLVHGRPTCARDAELPFLAPLVLGASLGLAGAMLQRRPVVLAAGGALLHASLVATAYVLLNPTLVPSAVGAATLLGVGLALATLTSSRAPRPSA